MPTTQVYQSLLTPFIQRHMVMLGPNVILSLIRHVPDITVTTTGAVNHVSGDPTVLLEHLSAAFVPYAGILTSQTLADVCAQAQVPLPPHSIGGLSYEKQD